MSKRPKRLSFLPARPIRKPMVWGPKVIGQGIILTGAVIGVLYGGGVWFQDWRNNFDIGKQTDLQLVEQRLNEKIEGDNYDRLQQRLWRLEDRYGPQAQKAPDTVREEYRRLQDDKARIERQQNQSFDPRQDRRGGYTGQREKY